VHLSSNEIATERHSALYEEEAEVKEESKYTESIPSDLNRIQGIKHLQVKESDKQISRTSRLDNTKKRQVHRLSHLGDEPLIRQTELVAIMNKRYPSNGKQEGQQPEITFNSNSNTDPVITETGKTPVAKKSGVLQAFDHSVPVEILKVAAGIKDLFRLGEYSDRKVLIPLNQPIEGVIPTSASTKQELFSYIFKWIGCVTDNVTK